MEIPYKHGEACLQLLAAAKQPVTLADLMAQLQLSRRSVLYLLKNLTNFLEEQQLEPIESIPRLGYLLPASTKKQWQAAKAAEADSNILLQPETMSLMLKNLTSKDRKILIDFLLISHPGVSLQGFIAIFHASRNTILHELRELNAYNAEAGLAVGKMAKGRRITSSELQQRHWVLENFPAILRLLGTYGKIKASKEASLALHAYEESVGSLLTDDSRHMLKYFLTWYCHRLQQGYFLTADAPATTTADEIQTWAAHFLAQQKINNAREVSYLCRIMQYNSVSVVNHADPLYQKLYASSQKLAQSFSSISGLSLATEEHVLLDGLTIHLISAYHRLKNHVHYHNPLLEKIKGDYKNLFYITKTAVHTLEKDLDLHFSDDETALLATYFGSAIIRNKIAAPQRRILVACSSGIGTSQFLLLQLRQRYPQLRFTGPLNVENCCRMNMQDVGLIITTAPLPLKGRQLPPVLHVSPLPTRYEWQKLKEQLILLNFESDQHSQQNIQALIDVIAEYAKIEDYNGLAQGLQKFFAQQDATGGTVVHDPTMNADSILKYVSYSDAPQMSWQSAISYSFYDLLRSKFIEQRYIDRVISLLAERGDYMVLGKGILLAHARPEDGVRQCSAALTLFRHPFLTSRQRPIRCIISLAPADASSHLTFLAQLLEKLNTPNWCEQLYKITSQHELEQFIWQSFQ